MYYGLISESNEKGKTLAVAASGRTEASCVKKIIKQVSKKERDEFNIDEDDIEYCICWYESKEELLGDLKHAKTYMLEQQAKIDAITQLQGLMK